MTAQPVAGGYPGPLAQPAFAVYLAALGVYRQAAELAGDWNDPAPASLLACPGDPRAGEYQQHINATAAATWAAAVTARQLVTQAWAAYLAAVEVEDRL